MSSSQSGFFGPDRIEKKRNRSSTPIPGPEELSDSGTSSGVGFRVHALNQPSIPRQRWTERSPPAGRRKLRFEEDQIIAKQTADNPKLQDTLLRKAKDKRKDQGRFTSDLKRTYKWRPQSGSSSQNSCFIGVEPQVGWPAIGTQLGLDHATHVTVGEAVHMGTQLTQSVNNLVNVVSGFQETFERNGNRFVVEHQGEALTRISQATMNLSEISILVVVVVFVIILKPETPAQKSFAFLAVSGILLTRFDLSEIMERSGLTAWFSRAEPEPQIGGPTGVEDITTIVTSFVNLYVAAHFGRDLLDPKEFLRVTTLLSRSTPTVANITKGIHLVVEFLSNCAFGLLGGDGFVKTGHVFIDKFFKDANLLIEQWESKELYNRSSSVDRVKEVIAYGEDVILKLPVSGEFANIRVLALGSLTELRKIRQGLLQSNFKYAGPRHEPATLLLRGEPGVFKSQAMQHFGHAVNARTLSEEDFRRYRESPTATTYNRQFENVFWEGFSSDKKVIFFDDILQCKDVQGNPDNEIMNVIRAINIFESILHMADMKDKGNTHCRPDFVIANTNMMTYNLESIHMQSAFTRRWDIVVDVIPKAEYSIDPNAAGPQRKFDVTKFPLWKPEECVGREHLIGVTRTHPDMCEFVLQKLTPDGRNFEPLQAIPASFSEIVDMLVDIFEMKQRRYSGYLGTLDDTLIRERARYEMLNGRDKDKVVPEVGGSDSNEFLGISHMFRELKINGGNLPNIYVAFTDVQFRMRCFQVKKRFFRDPDMRIVHSKLRPNYGRFSGFGLPSNWVVVVDMMFDLFEFPKERVDGTPVSQDMRYKVDQLVSGIKVYFALLYGGTVPETLPSLNDIPACAFTVPLFSEMVVTIALSLGAGGLPVELKGAAFLFKQDARTTPGYLCFGWGFAPSLPISLVLSSEGEVRIQPEVGGSSRDIVDFQFSSDDESASPTQEFVLPYDKQLSLDFIKFVHYPKYAMFTAVIRGCCMRAELEQQILEPEEVYDTLLAFNYDTDLSVKLDAADLKDPEPLVDFVYPLALKASRRKLKRVDEVKVEGVLEKASGTVSALQKKLYDFYIYCVLAISTTGAEFGNYALKWAFEDEKTRRLIGAGAAHFISGVTAFNMAKRLVQMVFTYFGDAQSNERSSKTHRSRRKISISRRVRTLPQSLITDNQNLVSVMQMVVNNNLFILNRPEFVSDREGKEDVRVHMGYCLAVSGRCLLMPYHFASVIDSHHADGELLDDDRLDLLVTHNGVLKFSLTVKQFLQGMLHWDPGCDQDIILVRMPRNFQPVRSLVKHFATEKQQSCYTNCDAHVYVGGLQIEDENIKSLPPQIISVQAQRDHDMNAGGFDEWAEYVVKEVYTYRAGTSKGDCGSPLFIDDKQKTTTILGFHVAGIPSRRLGFSTMITRELLDEYLKFVGEDYIAEDPEEAFGISLRPVGPGEGLTQNLGRVSPECMVPGRALGTSIRKSPIYEMVAPSPKAPARLRPFEIDGKKIDPMDLAMSGYNPGHVFISPDDLEEASDSLFDMLERQSTERVEKKIYCFEEAILGDQDGQEFRSIPRGTSSGYPYNVTTRPTNKTYFFGDGMAFDLTKPEALQLKETVLSTIEKMKQGVRCVHIFTDSLKDERRSLKKVKEGNTRMFSATPLVYYILIRMYFGSFTKWIIKNRIKNGISIGVNEYSSEWDLAARLLNMYGEGSNKGAGDFQGLDKKEIPACHLALVDKVNEWYDGSSEENKIRNILALDLVSSLHINRGILQLWDGAMPSGHGLTACFNSLNVHLYFRLCWKWLIQDSYGGSHLFNRCVFLLVLGDDNVFAVHPKYISLFNELSISKAMQKLGQVYTAADKEAELTPDLSNLTEVTFLKRKWRYDPRAGRYVAPLDLESVLDILNWVKKGGNAYGDTEANIDVVLHELTLHGRVVFDYWSKRILDAIDKVPGLKRPVSTSFTTLFQEVLKRDGPFWETRLENTDLTPKGYVEALPPLIYDEDGDNSPVIQPESGRLGGKGADLFRFTSRMARGQSPQYPGNRTAAKRSARCALFIGAATNDSNPVDKPGQESNGVFTTVHSEEGTSGANSGTTQSSNDAGANITKMQFSPLSRQLLDNARTNVSNEIADFLAKPKLITSGTLATTDTFASPKFSYSVPSGFINVAGDIWANKLAGTFAFKGELHITLQVNGNRFQQGRYILAWVPTGGAVRPVPYVRAHSATITQVTQLPHVELDVNCDTECTLVVPMLNAQGWSMVNTSSTFGDVGTVFCVPYSPLVAPAGSNVANFSLFAHYEKVEIAMPTVPQSGRARTRVRRRVRGIAEQEQESGGIGPIQSIASNIATIGRTAAGVPLLSSVAAPVAWAADIATRAASAFGWARPKNDGPAQYMSKQIMHRFTNVDAPDNSVKMAYFDRNELEDLPDFAGSGIDEMSLNYIAGISAYYGSTSWTTAQGVGTLLMSDAVYPKKYMRTTTQASRTISHLTPIAFVSSFFSMWRGSIRITVKIVKTEFHSGRIAVCFQPVGPDGTAPVFNLNNTAFLHRTIIDIRMGNEFTIEIPYMAFSQYKSCYGPDNYTGFLYMAVINPLVAPANVSSSVILLFEASAGDDFEWAAPCKPSGNPVLQWAPQVGRSDCEIVVQNLGHATDSERDMSSRACIGERILSFRSLLKRFCVISPTTDPGLITTRWFNFFPSSVGVSQYDSTPAYIVNPYQADNFDRIASCYCFFRGSMRWKFINADKQNDSHYVGWAYPRDVNAVSYNVDVVNLSTGPSFVNSIYPQNRTMAVFRGDATGGMEADYPFYCQYPVQCIADTLSTGTVKSTPNPVQAQLNGILPKQLGSLQILDASATAQQMPIMMRAMGEDGSLGMFVSVLPLDGYDPNYYN